VTAVFINGQPWKTFDASSVSLPYDKTPDEANIQIILGDAKPQSSVPRKPEPSALAPTPAFDRLPASPEAETLSALAPRVAAIREFHARLTAAGLGDSYEAAHARLAVACVATACQRLQLAAEGKLAALPPKTQTAADQSYVATASNLCKGLENVIQSYSTSDRPLKQKVYRLWNLQGAGTGTNP
jgi:hypothetical protein